jgi:hypothetical protein
MFCVITISVVSVLQDDIIISDHRGYFCNRKLDDRRESFEKLAWISKERDAKLWRWAADLYSTEVEALSTTLARMLYSRCTRCSNGRSGIHLEDFLRQIRSVNLECSRNTVNTKDTLRPVRV